jgi:hypothetical protein
MGILSRVGCDQRADPGTPQWTARVVRPPDHRGVIDVWRVPPSVIRDQATGKGFPDEQHPFGAVDHARKAFS